MSRFSVCKYLTAVIILLAALLFCGAQAASPTASFTFDKSSYNLGDTVTVHYKINFSGQYSKLEAQWGIVTDWKQGDSQWDGNNTRKLSALEGDFSFKPTYGEGVAVQINLWDSNGEWHILESKFVQLKGDASPEPKCTISFDKNSYSLGEEVTAHYVIDYAGQYTKLEAQWGIVTNWKQGDSQWDGDNTRRLSALEGDFSFKPAYGEGVAVQINLWDSNGEWHIFESKPVQLKGDASPEPKCTISFDKDSYRIGEEVTAHYAIDYAGQYTKLEAQWGIVTDWKQGDSQWDGDNTRRLSALEGDFSFKPTYGEGVTVQINLWDSNGEWHIFESESVRLKEPAGPLTEYQDKATVKAVQEALNNAGYPCGTPDGLAGKKTKAALTDYQTAADLTVTGTITHETLVHMGLAN